MSPLACQTEFNTLLFLVFFPCDPSWSLLNFCLQCGPQREGGKERAGLNRGGIRLARTAPYTTLVCDSVSFTVARGAQKPAQPSFKLKSPGDGDVAQLVEYSPTTQEALGSILNHIETRYGVGCL